MKSSTLIRSNNSKPTTKILIVDNHNFGNQLIINGLRKESGIEVVGTTQSELETLVEIQSLEPNVVVIDLDISEIDCYQLIKKINDNFNSITILVLTEQNQPKLINKALTCGAKGFLIKTAQTEEISSAIHSITYDYARKNKSELPSSHDDKSKVLIAEYQDRYPLPPKQTVAEELQPQSSELAIIPSPTSELPVHIAEREDWSAATNDLLEALPKVWTRGLLYFLIAITGIVLPWSAMTKVDQTGVARGRLEPKNKVVRLDAPVAGKVQSITIKEGDKVKKGAILAELGSEIVSSELEQLQEKQRGLQARLIQIESSHQQALSTVQAKQEENESRLLEKQSQLAQAQQDLDNLKSLYASQKSEKLAQIDQVKEAINASVGARKEAKLALSGAQAKSKRYQAAYQEGVIAQDLFLDIEQQAKENAEKLAQANSALLQAKSKLIEQESSYENLIKQSKSEIEQASLRLKEQLSNSKTQGFMGRLEKIQVQKQIKDLETQITALKTEITQTDKQIESAQFQLKQHQIVAPTNGTVFHISARGKGTIVQPGEEMIEIAPENSTLVLKAYIPPTDSGFLKLGMPVKVKFDAYPFQDYGISDGKLISISPDSKVTETPQGQQESYELEISLNQPYIIDRGEGIFLTAGQTATAEVLIRQRRVLDFFIDPFKQLQKDGVKL